MSHSARRGFTLVELLVVIAIIGILVALLLPAVQAAREASRRSSCSNNLKQLGIALHNYHDTYKRFPAGCVASTLNAGGPTFPTNMSWMPYLLPFMEQSPLWDKMQPFISTRASSGFPSNLMNTTIPTLVCPSDGASPTNGVGAGVGSNPDQDVPPDFNDGFMGNYLACGGKEQVTAANGNKLTGSFFYSSRINFASQTDGTSNTMVFSECRLVQMSGNSRDWRGRYYRADHLSSFFTAYLGPNPRTSTGTDAPDLCRTCNEGVAAPVKVPCQQSTDPQALYARSYHPGGVQVTMGDGSTRFVSQTVDINVWQAAATRAGEEALQLE